MGEKGKGEGKETKKQKKGKNKTRAGYAENRFKRDGGIRNDSCPLCVINFIKVLISI